MKSLSDMLWIEIRKSLRSRIPLWTALGSLLMPLGIAFLIFAAKNQEISQKLGLISVKANLVAYSATNWAYYLSLTAMIIAAGGFFLFVLIISWIFGREFVDGTVKDLLSVPIQRSILLLAKFIVASGWFVVLVILILFVSLLMGIIINLPGASTAVILHGILLVGLTTLLVIAVSLPFALFASIGKGYILPLATAFLCLIMANVIGIAGWGGYFPWAIPGLYAQGNNSVKISSYVIVILTGLVGLETTFLWWKYADQNR